MVASLPVRDDALFPNQDDGIGIATGVIEGYQADALPQVELDVEADAAILAAIADFHATHQRQALRTVMDIGLLGMNRLLAQGLLQGSQVVEQERRVGAVLHCEHHAKIV